MAITPADLESMEKFFASVNLPVSFKLNAAITINDLPAYVNKIVVGIKNQQFSEAIAAPRLDDLVEIRKLLAKQS